ncbi:DUF4240 domain-containing protein [Frankia sp. CNm7]|uniref:DUF4240 domain-containing protein n=1 Tax=Frankia nepalensis TaxID=1836974 RepID=A0A937UUW1_9ACTN|nr:DUF4240 domain-containing protein [Frankia nepalensis]MBL7496455.1 DUF4240 domain-containing protein [Frankia nepalensis]MBL7510808.1 DUF4240 domain-containing protein [Frankia nepalensis]MBL7521695.1 DUF4240 domain-containing protein [Frankia nepalensis]MBL7631606.1 DUF4240 domain-containing protein [Frankia nepalensis]
MVNFWRIVGSSELRDASDVDSALEKLSGRLAVLGPEELVRFSEKLREALYRLDRRGLAEIPVNVRGMTFPQTDDQFLYARCACILAGEDVYDATLRFNDEFARFATPFVQRAERLLYLPSEAYEKIVGRKMESGSGFPIDSGSNVQGWLD